MGRAPSLGRSVDVSRRRRLRRHVRVPPDLTSLFDVLFIVIFAALIRAAAVEKAAAEAAAPKPTPAPVATQPLAVAALQSKALAQVSADLAARPVAIARITPTGQLSAVEIEQKRIPLDLPLLEHSPDPDVALAYLGDRSAELRVCRQIALHLGVEALAPYLVIVAPDAVRADLPHALYEGLRRDVERCQHDQGGLAVIVEPSQGATP
jgi:hypothetical protein